MRNGDCKHFCKQRIENIILYFLYLVNAKDNITMAYYTPIDTKDILSAKLPATVLGKFKDDVFCLTADMLKDKTIVRNLVNLLISTQIEIVIRDKDNEERLQTGYSIRYSDGDGFIIFQNPNNDFSLRTEFSLGSDMYGEKRLTVPVFKDSLLKPFYTEIMSQYLGL